MILHTLSFSHRAADPTWKHLWESVSQKIEGKDFVLIIHTLQKGTEQDFACGDRDCFVCTMM